MRYREFKIVESVALYELSDKVKKLVRDKFKQADPNLNDQQIDFYLDRWDKYSASFPVESRDITQLTFDQVEQLIDTAETKSHIKGKATTDTVDTSSQDTVYDNNNLLILRGDLKEKCIRYGKGYSWCISRRGANNLYFRYKISRDEPIFYFVFDRDRTTQDPWHAVVIYVTKDNRYMVALASNTRDQEMSWRQIESKTPKLSGLQNLFKYIPMNAEERSDYEKYNARINDKTYAAFSLEEKFKYIQFGHKLSPKKQQITPDELIGTYAKNNAANITSQTYARLRPGDQRKVQKAILTVSPGKITDFAIMLGAVRLPEEHEKQILKNTTGAIKYAEVVLKGRWPELEAIILKSTAINALIGYANRIIRGRWPEAEQRIVKLSQYKWNYLRNLSRYAAEVAQERIPEFEKLILQDILVPADDLELNTSGWGSATGERRLYASSAALDYARDVIKGRWLEYEKLLKDSKLDGHKKYYAKLFNIDPAELGTA
jgi:hypothetical protein